MHKAHILVVDDEPMIVDVVRAYLEKDGYRVTSAGTGREAVARFEEQVPDLVVLDLMLPDLSGESVCQIIRRQSRVPIIMLTAKASEEDLIKGLGLGADDYVTKPFSPRQLLARIQAVLRRGLEQGQPLANWFCFNDHDLTIDCQRHEVKSHGKPVSLTPIEFRLLMTLMTHPARVFTRDELIAHVMDDDYQGTDRTIDSHIKNLRQKIEADSKEPRYILTVHGIGYKFGGQS